MNKGLPINQIIQGDCLEVMQELPDNSVDLTLTDIPYGVINRSSCGLRNLDKGNADIITFEVIDFLSAVYRLTSGTMIIFCGNEQYSEIYDFFNNKQKLKEGTVRQIIWAKNNPSPMNGQHIYLSGTENAVFFKKSGGTFNAHCKKNVFQHPVGRSKLHPTEKNHKLLKELILDNSNEQQIVFDPCCGSGSHLLVSKLLGRKFIGIEISPKYVKIARERLRQQKLL